MHAQNFENIGFNFTITYKYKTFDKLQQDLQDMWNHEEKELIIT